MSNKYKYTFLSGLLLAIVQITSGQSFLNNDSLSFKILRQSGILLSEKEMTPVMYFIRVSLSPAERKVCKEITNEDWLKMLTSDKTDWIANLILYDLYKKDAISYVGQIKSRDEWNIIQKKEDIEFWKEKLTAK